MPEFAHYRLCIYVNKPTFTLVFLPVRVIMVVFTVSGAYSFRKLA